MTSTTPEILGSALQSAAERGIAAGRDGTAVDNTAPGIALSVLTEGKLADRTIVYPTVTHRRQAEAAVQAMADKSNMTSRIRDALGRLGPGQYVEDAINLGGGTYVVKIGGREPGTLTGDHPYTVVFETQRTSRYHRSLDEALLYAIELRHGGRDGDRGYVFAARALGVKTAYDV